MNRFSREKSFENIACPCTSGGFRAVMRVQGEAIGAPMSQEASSELAKTSRPDVDSLRVRGIETWMTGHLSGNGTYRDAIALRYGSAASKMDVRQGDRTRAHGGEAIGVYNADDDGGRFGFGNKCWYQFEGRLGLPNGSSSKLLPQVLRLGIYSEVTLMGCSRGTISNAIQVHHVKFYGRSNATTPLI